MANIVRRPRRLRSTAALRDLVSEVQISNNDLIAPLFIKEALDEPVPISSLPGIYQHSVTSAIEEARRLNDLGVKGFMLFGVPSQKDPLGTQGYDDNGITQLSIGAFKEAFGDQAVVMADLCLDEFTDHGHCGVLDQRGCVDNDKTLELYGEMALAQARSGVDFVAPSGMMDGQVAFIRQTLDQAGFVGVGILAYSAKYASAFYGPFRDAVDVTIANGGDRKGYQQDFRNRREAILEIELDISEGADMVMVKPASSYLDIISTIRPMVNLPIAAYQVSGEYAMVKAADAAGYIDGTAVALEQLHAIKRAGADFILTYFSHELAEILR
ncbi:porphobilinogen synthase [Acidithrix ferrooxidans]|uniref:Delta-aminolevulinic acid dehydratase n=1 Tax=Acidithrix ferrooxidans TaxID=1280514 RepID=A0A0D8HE09_9ACTN|nr:porphobilinogen synthase [Acidithrix ferrooxidans]KJF16195.1 delta-aminolevulinic acid dehydratase [Acidithrix ferrooxidans]